MKLEFINQKREELNDLKFRCSKAGSVVTASGKLTEGAKTYGMDIYNKIVHGYEDPEVHGVTAIEKGHILEAATRDLIRRLFSPNSYLPDSQREVVSEFFIGHIDAENEEYIFDAKNCQNIKTFGKAELSHDHEWQMKAYLLSDYLNTGKLKKGMVVYTLFDMPEELLKREYAKIYRLGGYHDTNDERYVKECEQLRRNNVYPHLEDWDRVKPFEVELASEDIEKMQKCAKQLKDYILGVFESEINRGMKYKAW